MTLPSDLAAGAKAWPFEQARLIVERLKKHPKDVVVFETGYGPSGLPHIGTFGEVARTTMVKHAFEVLTAGQVKTKLICVSDDMDGMRKLPDNVPNHDLLKPYLQRPLTDVPDPFGSHESFAHHNNARLRSFLDSFGFHYEFASATALYRAGAFDATLLRALERYDDIMAVMLPTLGPERRATYSPFLPISPKSGRVLYVPMKGIDAKAGTITFEDEDGEVVTSAVTGGRVKMQWKPDFGMRWAALGVDFEMMGKDHQPNQGVYARICKILGAEPPINFVFELFLDDKGEKISKTKGNGIAVEDWLRYAPQESLALYQYQKPKTAKRLYFDVIPKAVDEYLAYLDAYPAQTETEQMENPVWHIHNGAPPPPERTASYAPMTNAAATTSISFALLLNLVSAANAETKDHLWKFIAKYAPGASPASHPRLDQLCGYAIAYYDDFVRPAKRFRPPTQNEREAFEDLARRLRAAPAHADAEALQNIVYEVGKEHGFEPLRDWFKALYEVLLGQEQGPRFGSFVAIFGVADTVALIERGLTGALVSA